MVDVEVAPWLAALPSAPVFQPSVEEFADPIAYILKIEREAAKYGICKIIPPLSRAPDATVISNLNASLNAIQQQQQHSSSSFSSSCSAAPARGGPSSCLARSMTTTPDAHARLVAQGSSNSSSCSSSRCSSSVSISISSSNNNNSSSSVCVCSSPSVKFTTRRQQLGWNPRRPRGGSQYRAQKLVWESGELYTVAQFQEKAKALSSAVLGCSSEHVNPLTVETLFWKAELDNKPIAVEYANDIPGSAFLEPQLQKEGEDGLELARTAWNVRSIARSHGSLLKFMLDEVPGVTTPMVYLGMLFSWFAWHVEDHELHSLNYLHSGARKTWYAVPSGAAAALEDAIRIYGYGGRLSPRSAFTLLGEKTTILSPEVLISAGVPCCRLVQDPGDYVITFPRAYHLGFSHGFNCGEAANFATPAWLEVAREAAARRASMSHLPMLSHEQLLYLFSASLVKRNPSLRVPSSFQVEEAVKAAFVKEVKDNSLLMMELLSSGVEGCVLLGDFRHSGRLHDIAQTLPSSYGTNDGSADCPDKLSDIAPLPTPWGALPCSTCGILCFGSMALVQPSADLAALQQRNQNPEISVEQLAQVPDGHVNVAVPGLCVLNSAPEQGGGEHPEPDVRQTKTPPPPPPLELACTEPFPEASIKAEDDDVAQDDSYSLPLPASYRESPSSCLTLGGSRTEGDEVTIEETEEGNLMPASTVEHPDPYREALCSFNRESDSFFSAEDDDYVHPDLPKALQDEALGACVSNEARMEDEDNPGQEIVGSWNFSKGCARPFVFCLQHAVYATSLLRPVGGATVLAIFHPNFDTIQANAEKLARDIDCSHSWEPVPLRHASSEEMEIISRAIHLKPDNSLGSNWMVRLGITNQSSCPQAKAVKGGQQQLQQQGGGAQQHEVDEDKDRSMTEAAGSGEEEGRIVGRWCGRVWRAPEVHPLMGGCKVNDRSTRLCSQKRDTGELHKRLRNAIPSFLKLPQVEKWPKKMRRENGQGADRMLTAAILRKSKRNAVLKAVRERGRRKAKEQEEQELEEQQLQRQLQEEEAAATGASACTTNVRGELLSHSSEQPWSGLVKWHDVPLVSCSSSVPPIQEQQRSSDHGTAPLPLCCTTSQQDTTALEGRTTTGGGGSSSSSSNIVTADDVVIDASAAQEPPPEGQQQQPQAKKRRVLGEVKKKTKRPRQARADEDDDGDEVDAVVNDEEKSSVDMDAAPVWLISSKKRSNNKARVKRASWSSLLSRLGRPEEASKSTCCCSCKPTTDSSSSSSSSGSTPATPLTHKACGCLAAAAAAAEAGEGELPPKNKEEQETRRSRRRGKVKQQQKQELLQQQEQVQQQQHQEQQEPQQEQQQEQQQQEQQEEWACDVEGCSMRFGSAEELGVHKRNRCTHPGCGKAFFSHKYLVQHRRVHLEERPLKCPWQGCAMSFKWAWARTEHIRVHTGERPYACPDCLKTFRFVSDFSRHKRNTGHAKSC